MPVNPDIANAAREILRTDFRRLRSGGRDSQTSELEERDIKRESEEKEPTTSRLFRPTLVGLLFAGVGLVVYGVAGPTIAEWFAKDEPPASLAMVEDAEPTQRLVFDDGTMYLEGLVPDRAVSDILESAAVAAVGRDRVVNNFEISDLAVYNPDQPIRLSVAEPVLFTTGAAMLDEQYRPLIDVAVDLMEAEPSATLTVVGHTDNVGSDELNLALSLKRAEAVGVLVIEHGIDASRVTVDGRGEAEPLESNETAEGRAVNRRVDFSIFGVFGN